VATEQSKTENNRAIVKIGIFITNENFGKNSKNCHFLGVLAGFKHRKIKKSPSE
jgi:hypothetical protein